MKKLTSLLLAVGLTSVLASSQSTTSYSTSATNFLQFIKTEYGTNFLTLKDREFVKIDNLVVIRNVTDAEWSALTNRYTNITKTFVFYSK